MIWSPLNFFFNNNKNSLNKLSLSRYIKLFIYKYCDNVIIRSSLVWQNMKEKFRAASYTITKAIKHRYKGIIFWRVMICEIRLKNRMWNQIYNKYKMHFWWFRYNFRGVNSPDQLLARNYLSQFKGQHQNKHRKACCIPMEKNRVDERQWDAFSATPSAAFCSRLLWDKRGPKMNDKKVNTNKRSHFREDENIECS